MNSDIEKSIQYQSDRYINEILNDCINNARKKNNPKKYKYIFGINYIVSRPELSEYWNKYFKRSISFLFEAYCSISLGQTDGGYFLLRSSVENFVKFVAKGLGEESKINDRGFKDNNRILINYAWQEKDLHLKNKANNFQTDYNNFSKLSHSVINSNENPISFFSERNKKFDSQYTAAMAVFKRIIKNYICFIVYLCKNSLMKWDSEDLMETLNIIFTENESKVIYKFLKS